MVEKIENNTYNRFMIDLEDTLPNFKATGEDIHKVINNVHIDYEATKKRRRDVKLTLYYRDLLSFLIKNYGH